jgi:hypothetical protein
MVTLRIVLISSLNRREVIDLDDRGFSSQFVPHILPNISGFSEERDLYPR